MTCPSCGNNLLPGDMHGLRVLACCCGFYRPAKEVAEKIPGLDPGPQHRQVPMLEKTLVERIRQALQRAGFRVMRVGQWYANKGGTDRGCPDLFVSAGGNVWVACEVKLPGYSPSDVRPEQRMLYEAGEIAIVTSEIEAIEVMRIAKSAFENTHGRRL